MAATKRAPGPVGAVAKKSAAKRTAAPRRTLASYGAGYSTGVVRARPDIFDPDDVSVTFSHESHVVRISTDLGTEMLLTPEAAQKVIRGLEACLKHLGFPHVSDEDFEAYRQKILGE